MKTGHKGELRLFCAAIHRSFTWIVLMIIVVSTRLAGCVVYEPAPVPMPASTFERSWGAALAAAQDEGIRLRLKIERTE